MRHNAGYNLDGDITPVTTAIVITPNAGEEIRITATDEVTVGDAAVIMNLDHIKDTHLNLDKSPKETKLQP